MAFNPNPGRNEYTATSGQTLFTFNFKIYNTSDILVYQTPSGQAPDDTNDILTNVIDYTVVINGDSGGTVTLISPATLNDSITFVRDLPVTRSIEYQRLGDMSAQTVNLDQDYQTYLILDQENRANRHMALPESAQNVSSEIPSPVPLNFFQWNATGDAIVNVNSLQADGYVWTAAEIYTQTESDALFTAQTDFDDKSKLWDAQTTTHDFTTDADYTLTAAQNLYGRIILTDTGVVLTVARNVITDNIEKVFTVQNDTAQGITVKTLAGTGILIPAGIYANLYNDGTNIIELSQIRLNASGEQYAGQAAGEEILKTSGGWIKNQCSAFVKFNGVTPTIVDSFNVSGVTKIGTGIFDIIFEAMDTADYILGGSGRLTAANAGVNPHIDFTVDPTITQARIRVLNNSNSATDGDTYVIFFGGKN